LRDFPDVLGMELNAASALLEAEGLAFRIIETKSTKKEPLNGILRVIRVQSLKEAENLVVTVCKI
jgi:beta-lactam-binding protein with PASTA domain